MTALFEVGPADIAVTTNDWYTPRWLFDAAGIMFDMDVAAPIDPSRRTCPARAYLTPVEDGLVTPWHGVVWMNPPFSQPTPWADKFAAHPAGLAIIPALPRAKWLSALMGSADALTLIAPEFGRPDGSSGVLRWPMVLVARGDVCADALGRIAAADKLAQGAHYVRPARMLKLVH